MVDQEETPPVIVQADTATPISKVDETLLVHFGNDVATQATRLDDLAKQMITLCLAVPSVYAVVLTMIQGKDAPMLQPGTLFLAFVFWLAALGLSLGSLIPERREIDPDSLTQIRAYFSRSAGRKFRLLCLACILNFTGIAMAVFSIF